MSAAGNGQIKVAVAGQGRSGWKIHVNALLKLPEMFQIVAVADQIRERRDEAQHTLGARVYDDWNGLLADGDFDLFVNALPSPLHVPASVAALNAGKHVLCEKPLAPNVNEFDRMTAAAKANNRVFAPFHNNRLQPFFDKIQEIVASGVLGKLLYIRSHWGSFARRWDWQTWQQNFGGVLYNTAPHAIDQALVLFGWEHTPEVFCRMACNNAFGADAEDHCTVCLYDPQGMAPQIDILVSSYQAYPQGDMYTINGIYGGISGGSSGLKWRYFDPDQAPLQKPWNWSVDRGYPREELPWVEKSWTLDEKAAGPAVGYTLKSFDSGPVRLYTNLYNVLHGKTKLLITPEQVRKQVAVLAECHRQNPLPRKPLPAYPPGT